MQYLCVKQLSLAGTVYYPGEIIPDSVILPERSGKLIRSKYISEFNEEAQTGMPKDGYSQAEVDQMVEKAVSKATEEMKLNQEALQEAATGLVEMESGVYEKTMLITLKDNSGGDSEQATAVPVTQEEVQRVFDILQLNAEEGAKAITEIKTENVLILLHAADSRKTIKEAAKKQADNLFSTGANSNESSKGNAITGTNTEGADT